MKTNKLEYAYIDLEVGDKILVKGFTNITSNGIYTVTRPQPEIPRMPQ